MKIIVILLLCMIFQVSVGTMHGGYESPDEEKAFILQEKQKVEEGISKFKSESLKKLMDIVENENEAWTTREAAAIVLGEKGKTIAIPSLEKLFKSRPKSLIMGDYRPGSARGAAAKAIVRIEMKKGLSNSEKTKFLLDNIKNKNSDNSRILNSRAIGAYELLKDLYKEDKSIVPLIIESLYDKRPYVRERIARFFQQCPDKQAVEPLIKILKEKDNDMYTKAAIVWALSETDDDRAVSAIEDRIKDLSEDKNIRISATRALGRLGKESASDTLLKFQNCGDKEIEDVVLESSSKIGGKRLLPLLKKSLNSKDTSIILDAKKSLEKLGIKVEKKDDEYKVIE